MDGMKVRRRARRTRRWGKWALAAMLALALVASLVAWRSLETPKKTIVPLKGDDEDLILVRRSEEEIARVEVTLRSGETWAVTRQDDGTLLADSGFTVAESSAQELLQDLSVIGCTRVLAEDGWAEQAADFGLDVPKARITVLYTDGDALTLCIGQSSGDYEDESYYYMTLEGDKRLFALDTGTAMELIRDERLLRPVTQPVIHKARIDAIRIRLQDGTEKAWALNGAITDGDAQDRWLLTAPTRYPADGERMLKLRENLANLRLGAYVAEATPENCAAYGLDTPRMVLTVHQAAGSIGGIDEDGAYMVVDWPESEETFAVGDAQTEVVDYVRYGDAIYVTSHFSVNTFMAIDPADTVTRYPVLTSLGNLAALTVETGGESHLYEVTRAERVAENNDLVYDDTGALVCDVTCTRDGEEIPWGVFEAAYNDMLLVTVSGRLPAGWTAEGEPHTRFLFRTVTGAEHRIELKDMDALHDAVAVDGCAMFYLIKGGLKLQMP